MELELGLKFTRVADEFTSDFQITKDRAGALFLSRETDTVFVLTAHLKGSLLLMSLCVHQLHNINWCSFNLILFHS